MHAARYLLLPWWVASLATGAKAFGDNPVLGSSRLNSWGLHAARARAAHRMAASRRHRLRGLIDPDDRLAFDRDGFVLKRDFLPPPLFEVLRAQALGYAGPAREMRQGDTVTRRLALDPPALAAMPAVAGLLADPRWRGLTRYAGSFDAEPMTYIQTVLRQQVDMPADPQTTLHADTFHATVKAWLFLTDVAEDGGPFVYVPGSHRMTARRLAWERERSIRAAQGLDRLSARGSLRIAESELPELGLSPPRIFAVPANTLVVADTSGFHARGRSTGASTRIEIWAYGRRNPFLPWTGLDPFSLSAIAPRRAPVLWGLRDRFEGLLGQPWRYAGVKRPDAPAVAV